MFVKPVEKIRGEITVPGDKSISHRAVMFSSIAEGESRIYNFLMGEDCFSTVRCMKKLGVPIEVGNNTVLVKGVGLRGLREPDGRLDAGNSGTTIRLLTGILSGQAFACEITGDASIRKRPMGRIIEPLRQMGAEIHGIDKEGCAPLRIKGRSLKGIHYQMPMASAQVKSAILLAGLYAEGCTTLVEPYPSRNHTELMLQAMGADIVCRGREVAVKPGERIIGNNFFIPGDISSAAFFMVLGAISQDGEMLIKDVGVNPTRTGIIDVLTRMGARIKVFNQRVQSGEPVGDLLVRGSGLQGIEVGGEMIPRLIDELPILAVAACFAEGITRIRDAQELKVKESNRIKTMVTELKKIGAEIEETEDGMVIQGTGALKGGEVESYGDHRVAMSLAIAGLASREGVMIRGSECVGISFPQFFEIIGRVMTNE